MIFLKGLIEIVKSYVLLTYQGFISFASNMLIPLSLYFRQVEVVQELKCCLMTCTLHHSDYSVLSKEVIFILDLIFIKTIIIQTPKKQVSICINYALSKS